MFTTLIRQVDIRIYINIVSFQNIKINMLTVLTFKINSDSSPGASNAVPSSNIQITR